MLNDTTTSSSPAVTSSRDDVTQTTSDVTEDTDDVTSGGAAGGHGSSNASQKIEYDVQDMANAASSAE